MSLPEALTEARVRKLEVDPIAVACYMHDHHLTNYTDVFTTDSFKDVGSLGILTLVTHKPRYLKWASNIREYYGKKFMMMKMQNRQLTRYREELFTYLNMPVGDYTYDHIGMIAGLPRMFTEDTILEDLRESFNNDPWTDAENHGKSAKIDLTFIDSHVKKAYRHHGKAKSEWMCYWCHDENDRLYMIEFDFDNPFRNYWQQTIEHTFRIEGTPIKHEGKDCMRYYTLVDWQIL